MDQSTPSMCLRQTKCRSIVSEEETRGTQNKVVSVNGSSSQARVTPYISFAEVDSLSVVGYAVHHCILSDSLTLSSRPITVASSMLMLWEAELIGRKVSLLALL